MDRRVVLVVSASTLVLGLLSSGQSVSAGDPLGVGDTTNCILNPQNQPTAPEDCLHFLHGVTEGVILDADFDDDAFVCDVSSGANCDGNGAKVGKVWSCESYCNDGRYCRWCLEDSAYVRSGHTCSEGWGTLIAYVGASWNDRIRSAQGLGGCGLVRVYQDEGFKGTSRDCTDSCETFGGLNDEISSLQTWPS